MKPIYKEMYVWETNEGNAKKRFVLHINVEGTCVAVVDDYKGVFRHGRELTVNWSHCKEITEKKKELMTHLDMFKLSKEGALFKDAILPGRILADWYNMRDVGDWKYSLDWEEKGLEDCTWLEPYKEV